MNSTTLTRVGSKNLALGLLTPKKGYGLEVYIEYHYYSFRRVEIVYFRDGEYSPDIVAKYVADSADTKSHYMTQEKGYLYDVSAMVINWKYHKSFNQADLPEIGEGDMYKVGFPRYTTRLTNGVLFTDAELDYWYFSREEKEGITDYINEHNQYSEGDFINPFSIEVAKNERKLEPDFSTAPLF